jgi:hypothetical protein
MVGALVSALMIKCPQTGLPVYTGIETDQISLNNAPDVPMQARCPACGGEHVWWKREAWLQEVPPIGGRTAA